MIQVQKNRAAAKNPELAQVDWLDSQKDSLCAHSYEMIFRYQ